MLLVFFDCAGRASRLLAYAGAKIPMIFSDASNFPAATSPYVSPSLNYDSASFKIYSNIGEPQAEAHDAGPFQFSLPFNFFAQLHINTDAAVPGCPLPPLTAFDFFRAYFYFRFALFTSGLGRLFAHIMPQEAEAKCAQFYAGLLYSPADFTLHFSSFPDG